MVGGWDGVGEDVVVVFVRLLELILGLLGGG